MFAQTIWRIKGTNVRESNYFCPQNRSQVAIVVCSKMRTGSRASSRTVQSPKREWQAKKERTHRHSEGLLTQTKFAKEFSRKRRTSFCRICELDPVRQAARCKVQRGSGKQKKKGHTRCPFFFLEAPPRFGLGIEVLQTFALPLGHGAIFSQQTDYIIKILGCQVFFLLFDFYFKN